MFLVLVLCCGPGLQTKGCGGVVPIGLAKRGESGRGVLCLQFAGAVLQSALSCPLCLCCR